MYGKPYHKMPLSSWMVPGGNRDQKMKLMKAEKYPMKSAIQKNLGGPLSEVFFSCLTPTQQDLIGFTPKLKGPGRNLWVSPSDILIGKVALKPPYTSRLRQALTHQGIMELGAEIEQKVQREHQEMMEQAVYEKEREMTENIKRMITDAVQADRLAQEVINRQILEKATNDLSTTYQEILAQSVSQLLEEGVKKVEEAVKRTRTLMERELCLAVETHQEYLSKQFEFQLAWQRSDLVEKYEQQLKKQKQLCVLAMDEAVAEFETKLEKVIAHQEAEHVTDLVIQGAEQSAEYHEEKKELESGFEVWFVKYFDDEIVDRDFIILEMEDTIRKLEQKCGKREEHLKKLFSHFQRFINFALKEKPGQAEFLLSLQRELECIQNQEFQEGEIENLARSILEYILKVIDDHAKSENVIKQQERGKFAPQFTQDNFRVKLQAERERQQMLRLVGEEQKSTLSEAKFRIDHMLSLANVFRNSPSIITIFNSILNRQHYKDSQHIIC